MPGAMRSSSTGCLILASMLGCFCAPAGGAPAAPSGTPAPASAEAAPAEPVAAEASQGSPGASATAAPATAEAATVPGGSIVISEPIQAALTAADRSEADKALDAGRQPDKLLAFFGIAPGMRVAELGAGGGYTAELLARVVGPSGQVFGQNNRFMLERFAEKPWSERLKKPVMKNVIRVDREFSDPLPPEAKNLDAVLCILFYHDTVWLKTDRDRMNKAIFEALKPGGVYGIVDHSARPGSGVADAETFHRIDEELLKREVTQAGFVVDATADFLRNPSDTRDWNASPRTAADRRGTSDRFVIRFKRP